MSIFGIGLAAAFLLSAADASREYAQADALVRSSRWDEGIELLRPLVRENPSDLKALNLLGIALSGKGDLAAANQEFQQVLRIDPRFLPALKNLAVNELALQDAAHAEKHLQAAAKLAPNDPVIHAYLGEIAYGHEDYNAAAAEFSLGEKRALANPEIAPHLVDSYLKTGRRQSGEKLASEFAQGGVPARSRFQIAVVLAQNERYQQAIPLFEAVQQQFPDSYNAGLNLAVCYVETRQYSQAIEILSAMVVRGHKTAELSSLLGEAYEGDHQTKQAIDAMREATSLAPEDENSYLVLASLCADHRAYLLGLEVVNTGLHYRPQSERLLFERGVLNAMLDRFDLAEQDFQLAAKLQPAKNLSYVGLGLAYMQQSDLPDAIRVLRQRVKANPDDAFLQYFLGEALLRSGVDRGDPGFAEARAALEASERLNANYAPSQTDLGKVYLMEGRLNEAVTHLEKALSLDPQEKSACSHLAIAYRRLGKAELAKSMADQLRRMNDDERAHNAREFVRIVKTAMPDDAETPSRR